MNSSLDTNIILRYIFDDVPTQCEKIKKLFTDPSQTLYVSDLVVSEVIFNLQVRKFSRSDIMNILKGLYELPNVVFSDFIKGTVLPFYETHPALSFVDCYAASEAEKKHWEPLWTFDRKLVNQHPSAKRVV